MVETLFWGSLGVVAFTFVGYAAMVRLLAGLRAPVTLDLAAADWPTVSVVMAVHNEEARIEDRIANLLASDYPGNRMELVIVSDGSTDGTVARVTRVADPRIKVLERPGRSGKAACLNHGVRAAAGEVIVFADARQRFAADAVRRLVAHLRVPRVGAVSGSLEIEASDTSVGGGVDAYWRLEKLIRAAEARWDSSIGCTGAIYAVWRELYAPIPEDTFLDDVVIPMQVALRGRRVLFDAEAKAFDPQQLEPGRETIRKQRTLAGNFQMFVRHPGWLLPWRNRLWWQLIAHKYLRLTAPLFLATALATNFCLRDQPFYLLLLCGQVLLYLLAILGMACRSFRGAFFRIPAGFVFLNWMTVRGLWYYLTGPRTGAWQRVEK